jgi:hypothetical protein
VKCVCARARVSMVVVLRQEQFQGNFNDSFGIVNCVETAWWPSKPLLGNAVASMQSKLRLYNQTRAPVSASWEPKQPMNRQQRLEMPWAAVMHQMQPWQLLSGVSCEMVASQQQCKHEGRRISIVGNHNWATGEDYNRPRQCARQWFVKCAD